MQLFRLAQLTAVATLFGKPRAVRLAREWRTLATMPEITRDLTMLGHLHESDIDPATGRMYPHDELIARAARKSLVLALFARAEITPSELNSIRMESHDDENADD